MKITYKKIFYLFVHTIFILILNKQSCASEKNCYSNMQEVIGCFIKHNDGAFKYELISKDSTSPDVTIITYTLDSQKWPVITYANMPATTWQHKLVFYLPKKRTHAKALLYANGGYNKDEKGKSEKEGGNIFYTKNQIDYAAIAISNEAPVIELRDTLNQCLFFDNKPVRGDQIIAYTYKMVMDNPMQNAYLAGHLPMVKAITKAMDASQEILAQKYDTNITGFILSGASKEGLAVWLAALEDSRVEAIIPIVADMLNTRKSMQHICDFYGECPLALNDYKKGSLLDMRNTQAAADLMKIEDPFMYLSDDNINKYKDRLAISKYIINASGDDIFVPDLSKLYFDKLPGDSNYIRYLPNTRHFFTLNLISLQLVNEAINSYFYFILHKSSLPKVNWELHVDKIKLNSSLKPKKIKLWSSNNKYKRDFRYFSSYFKLYASSKPILSSVFKNSCNNCYSEKTVNFACDKNRSGDKCEVSIKLPAFKKGWQASFAEVHYEIDSVPFVVTTEVNIQEARKDEL